MRFEGTATVSGWFALSHAAGGELHVNKTMTFPNDLITWQPLLNLTVVDTVQDGTTVRRFLLGDLEPSFIVFRLARHPEE